MLLSGRNAPLSYGWGAIANPYDDDMVLSPLSFMIIDDDDDDDDDDNLSRKE